MSNKKTSDDHARDNRANQLNPNNDAYWTSRGQDGRPEPPPAAPSPASPPPSTDTGRKSR